MAFSLGDMIEECELEKKRRLRDFPRAVSAGLATQAEADRRMDLLDAIKRKLQWLRDNEDIINGRWEKVKAEVADHAAVQAVMSAFPDAEISKIRKAS